MKTKVLAFDFGASSGRAILGEYDGVAITYHEAHRFENNTIMHKDKLCWDFHTLLEEVHTSIKKAGKIDSIAFDTWGVDYGLIDKHGKIIGLPVCYRDTRTNGILKTLSGKIPLEELYSKTGTQVMELNTLMQLLSDDLQEADKLLFMPDLFAYMLCGAKVCEQTIFSTSQMCDPTTHKLCKEVLAIFNIDESLFARNVKSGTIIGEYNSAKIISVAGHDTQSAVAAMPSNDSNVAFLSCGTWSLLGTELDEPILTEESYKMGFSNEVGANDKINYLKNITGLWLIQECRRHWKSMGEVYSYAQLEQLAAESTAPVAIIDVDDPRFATPRNMPQKIADYCIENELYVPQTIGEYCSCIYHSLADKYAKTLAELSAITGKNFTALHILGGGSQSKLLCKLSAQYCKLPVHAGPVEATALGNILIQLIALDKVKDIVEGRKLIADTMAKTV